MKKSICDFDLNNKKVIIRCDLNVPIKNGKILDDNRIVESLKTIKYAISNNAKVIILSHLGRIKSADDKEKNSLAPVANRLSDLLGTKVKFINETRGSMLEDAVKNMNPKDVILVQNTRYEDYPFKKESSNDKALAKYWASLADVFINDAFGTCHRAHASNAGIAKYLPSGVGFLVEKEMKMLTAILNNPKRPFVVILGGAKMSDKIKVIDNLIEKADYALLAGGIANTFLTAKGYDLKASLYDEQSVDHAKRLIEKYSDKIILPVDGYASSSYQDNLEVKYYSLNEVEDNMMVLDIGPKTVDMFSKYINLSNTIFMNGPVGVFEFSNFEYGTKSIFKILKESSKNVVIGGGDSAAAAIKFGYKDAFSHISTGGGASLEYIEGKVLPAIEIIENK